MRDQRWSEGLTTGAITAAATAGAFVAFGHRLGSAALPFDAAASVVLGRGALLGAAGVLTIVVGVVVHVAMMLALGVLFAFEPGWARRLGVSGWVWALALAAAGFLLSIILARVLGIGVAAVLPLGDRIVLAALVAVALPLGMRFAFPVSRRAR